MTVASVIASEAKQSSASVDCRVAALLAMTSLVGACQKVDAWKHPEVAACEDFTKAKLKAPATYKQAKSTVIDEKLSLETWNRLQKARLGAMSEQFEDLTKQSAADGGIRSVLLEYDAQNGFGVPMRGTEICKFLLSSFANNKFEVEPDAESAKLARMIWQLDDKSVEEPMCCLPAAQLAEVNRPNTSKAGK